MWSSLRAIRIRRATPPVHMRGRSSAAEALDGTRRRPIGPPRGLAPTSYRAVLGVSLAQVAPKFERIVGRATGRTRRLPRPRRLMSAYRAREEHEDRHRSQYRTATGTIQTSPARPTPCHVPVTAQDTSTALAAGASAVRYLRNDPQGTRRQEPPHDGRRLRAVVRQSRREGQGEGAHREGADGHRQEGSEGPLVENEIASNDEEAREARVSRRRQNQAALVVRSALLSLWQAVWDQHRNRSHRPPRAGGD